MAQRGTAAETTLDRKTINKLTEEQMARFREHTPTSAEYFDRARKVMPGGVPSSFQHNDPWPIYIERGKGALVWDVDGNEYVDFHNGFGVMCVGHANPVIGEAVKARHRRGHPLRRTDRRLDRRRRGAWSSASACRSGASRTPAPSRRWTRSTSPAAPPDRDMILKIEGSYHGHHDAVMVSVLPGARRAGPAREPDPVPYGLGLPAGASSSYTRRSRSTTPTLSRRAEAARGQGRRADHGAGDDEHQHHPAGRRLPGAGPRAHHASTASS